MFGIWSFRYERSRVFQKTSRHQSVLLRGPRTARHLRVSKSNSVSRAEALELGQASRLDRPTDRWCRKRGPARLLRSRRSSFWSARGLFRGTESGGRDAVYRRRKSFLNLAMDFGQNLQNPQN